MLTEFVEFYNRVYADRTARWRAPVRFQLSILNGQSPFAAGRTLRPFVVREGETVLARVLAVVDARYNQHWQDRLGHLSLFEALPETREAVRLLMDEACDWLQSQDTQAARVGSGLLDFPFVIDAYDQLPPNILRYNPPYYHALLKDAGFETEKSYIDYKIAVRPELVARWESALEAAHRAGYEIVPLRDIPEDRRVAEFTATFNDTFQTHWGWTPYAEAEVASLFAGIASIGGLETSVMAYERGEPVGLLLLTPEHTSDVILQAGRTLHESEKLNVLAIGVREAARGRGVNLAMASYGFLELVRRGATYLSYTLVLDDNWPSRRTAGKLGAAICANYVVYRRNFR
jgi:hypothetical protein